MRTDQFAKNIWRYAAASVFFMALCLFTSQSQTVLADEIAGKVVLSGTLQGLNNHKTVGSVKIIKTAKGYVAVLGDDFFLDSAPDPQLAFGKKTAGKKRGYDKSTLFAKLKSKKGKQSFSIPAGIDPTKFNEIYVWCPKFYVGLGMAPLK